MKRVGVFAFFNKEGYVEDYVDYLLKQMNKNLDNLYIMVIGKLDDRGKKILSKYSKNIAYRENKGFTGGAWQDQILNQIGFDMLAKYDEAVFFNDIFYGPIYPIKKMFDDMSKKKLDFWGITRHYQTKDFTNTYEDGIIPEHIQTYFYVVRNKILKSEDFKNFWVNLPQINTAKDDVAYQETRFTNYFASLGYKWDTYVNIDELKGEGLNNYCMNYEVPYTLIAKYNMPFIRRKSLIQIIENSVSGPETEARRVLEYISKNTKYDINLIWDDLLRNNNLIDLYTKLHLDYILPTDKKLGKINKNIKFAMVSNNLQYKNNKYDFYSLNRVDINKLIKKYDYICYIDDSDINNENLLLNKSNKQLLFDNALISDEYIENIIYTFETNDKLGFLGLPNMISNSNWANLVINWNENIFNQIKDINNNISIDKAPITNTKAFFIKTSAYKNANIDINNIQYSLPYIGQNSGYYAGIVYSNEYASIYLPALIEEYKRYVNAHPYRTPETLTYSMLIKAMITKLINKFKR